MDMVYRTRQTDVHAGRQAGGILPRPPRDGQTLTPLMAGLRPGWGPRCQHPWHAQAPLPPAPFTDAHKSRARRAHPPCPRCHVGTAASLLTYCWLISSQPGRCPPPPALPQSQSQQYQGVSQQGRSPPKPIRGCPLGVGGARVGVGTGRRARAKLAPAVRKREGGERGTCLTQTALHKAWQLATRVQGVPRAAQISIPIGAPCPAWQHRMLTSPGLLGHQIPLDARGRQDRQTEPMPPPDVGYRHKAGGTGTMHPAPAPTLLPGPDRGRLVVGIRVLFFFFLKPKLLKLRKFLPLRGFKWPFITSYKLLAAGRAPFVCRAELHS